MDDMLDVPVGVDGGEGIGDCGSKISFNVSILKSAFSIFVLMH